MPRNLQRFQHTGDLHFITFSCYHRMRLLDPLGARRAFELTLERVRRWYGFFITGYVVMPEHVHLLVSEPERRSLAVAIQMLKQIASTDLRWVPRPCRCALCSGVAAGAPSSSLRSLERQGGVLDRSPGGPPLSVRSLDRQDGSARPSHPFWQARYYDFNLWTKRKIEEKLRYIHFNPVERGLVSTPEDWEWSSARHYKTGIEGVVEIESWWTNRKREAAGIFPMIKKRTG